MSLDCTSLNVTGYDKFSLLEDMLEIRHMFVHTCMFEFRAVIYGFKRFDEIKDSDWISVLISAPHLTWLFAMCVLLLLLWWLRSRHND